MRLLPGEGTHTVRKTLRIDGTRSSIKLEPQVWAALEIIGVEHGFTKGPSAITTQMVNAIAKLCSDKTNLASCVRIYAMVWFQIHYRCSSLEGTLLRTVKTLPQLLEMVQGMKALAFGVNVDGSVVAASGAAQDRFGVSADGALTLLDMARQPEAVVDDAGLDPTFGSLGQTNISAISENLLRVCVTTKHRLSAILEICGVTYNVWCIRLEAIGEADRFVLILNPFSFYEKKDTKK